MLQFQFWPSNNISVQITEFQGLLNQTSETGLKLENNISAMVMLNTLPSSYHQLVSTIVHSTRTKDFLPSFIGKSILQENSLRKATWSHGSANVASRIGEPAHAEAYQTSVIWDAPTNMRCTKCNKTNHTTEWCWFNIKKPQSKPSGSAPFQKKQPYVKKQKAKAYELHHKLKRKKKGKGKAGVHFADLELAHLA